MSDKQIYYKTKREYHMEYYQLNREYFLNYSREYYKKNREAILKNGFEYNKKYRDDNREKINKKAREYYWIKQGKPIPEKRKKHLLVPKKIKGPVEEIKPLTKLQQKTAAIEEALAELQNKKNAFIAKLAEEKITM
jgi:hypothetical protein